MSVMTTAITNKLNEDLSKVTAKDFTKLARVITNLVAYFKFRALGPDSITKKEFASLVADKWIDPSTLKFDAMKTVPGLYIKTLKMLGSEDVPESIRSKTINFLKTNVSGYLDGLKQTLTNHSHAIIMGESHLTDKMRSMIGEGVEATDSNREIAEKLAQTFGRFTKHWQTVVTTELSHAQNLAAVDSILTNNKTTHPDDVYVYKVTAQDARVCKTCKKFWQLPSNPRIPKVYKLSELVATNIGQGRDNQAPTVSSQHPNCRCLLLQIPKGYGFDNGGNLNFVNFNHNEYLFQKMGF